MAVPWLIWPLIWNWCFKCLQLWILGRRLNKLTFTNKFVYFLLHAFIIITYVYRGFFSVAWWWQLPLTIRCRKLERTFLHFLHPIGAMSDNTGKNRAVRGAIAASDWRLVSCSCFLRKLWERQLLHLFKVYVNHTNEYLIYSPFSSKYSIKIVCYSSSISVKNTC